MPKYSIIIPTYSNLEHLKPCLESVIETSIDPEIIVVDNGSFDGTSAYLAFMHERYAHFLKIISLDTNKGYAGAINVGMKEAKGIYLICLNDDVLTTPKWNLFLSEAMEENSDGLAKIGIISPRTNYAVSHCCITEEESQYLGDPWGLANMRRSQFGKQVSIVPWVPGFAMMIRRELLEKIGSFDERYFPGGFEDNDLCARAWNVGYRTGVAEGVFVVHKGSQTFNRFYPQMNIGLNNLPVYLEKWRALRPEKQNIALASYIPNPSPERIDKIHALAKKLDAIPILEIGKEDQSSISEEREKQKEEIAIDALLSKAHEMDMDWIFFADPDDGLDPFLIADKLRQLTCSIDPLATIYAFPMFKIYQDFYDPRSCSFTARLFKLLPHRKNLQSLLRDAPLAKQVPFRITEPLDFTKIPVVELRPYFDDHQITACMIAKDEADRIDTFFFKHSHLFHDIIVMDTGSIDGTMERLKGWPVQAINDGSFRDFSSARNKVIEGVKTPWIMHLDWDEELIPDPGFFLQVHHPNLQGYFAQILSFMPQGKPSQTENIRLFRNKKEIQYKGMVHESVLESIIDRGQNVQVADFFKINHFGYLKSVDRIQGKLDQYERLLLEEIAQDPFRARPYYDLALHYINEGNSAKGREYFRRAIILKSDLLLPRKELAFEFLEASYKEFSYVAQGGTSNGFLTNLCKKAVSILGQIYEPRIRVGNPNG